MSLKADILQDRLLSAGVGEGHMAEFHGGAQRAFLQGKAAVPDSGLRVQDFCDALGAGICRGKHHNHKGQHHDGHQYHADILAVGHQRANLHNSGFHIVGAQP